MATIKQRLQILKKSLENSFYVETIIKKLLTVQKYHEYAFECDTGNSICNADNNIVVSLTTYSKRIHEVYLTIESLIHQTIKPSKIILWLAQDEFNEKNIPLILQKQKKRGLEIRFCEDIKSYKKLIPALKIMPDTAIITVDDDYIYPADFVERLINMHRQYPNCVCYYIGSRITIDKKGKPKPYCKWEHSDKEYIPSLMNFATGAGGILYPPHCFHNDITNTSLFMKYTPKADDIWFKIMTFRKNIKYVKTPIECPFENKFILLNNVQDIALYHSNVARGENDKQIKTVCEAYRLNFKDIE
ncbi:MAG: glycosyltransferase family 2 protein [Bacteroidales bacterium]|jgi:hypothetical protein|nr:glycosyltransferase family 2 protein [Bacteroidales bacterium]